MYSLCKVIHLLTIIFFFLWYRDHRDLHVLTHSFPTRRSSDLRQIPTAIAPCHMAMRIRAIRRRPSLRPHIGRQSASCRFPEAPPMIGAGRRFRYGFLPPPDRPPARSLPFGPSRSEGRGVGKEGGRTCRIRGTPAPEKKK